jgi:chemotaxis protein MotB
MVLILSVLLSLLQLSHVKAAEEKRKISVRLEKTEEEKRNMSVLLDKTAKENRKLSGAKAASVERTVPTGELNFATGSAVPEVTVVPTGILKEVTQKVGEGYRRIRVEGHTDNVPIHSDRFPSNWELSSARAIWLARQIESHLQRQGTPIGRGGVIVEAIGYGDRVPLPGADNATAEGRRRNRRITIRFERLPEGL